jgi:oligopeptide/dipeptide ABC transporter ATP-binding protein
MLDVSIRAGVLNLMLDLRDKYGIPYLFITHDIAVARYISDRLAVMYLGMVAELGETDTVIFSPKHPYTQALLSAVPVPDPEAKHGRIKIKGEIPSAANVPLGCRFRPRCHKAFKDCGWQGEDLVDWLTDNGLLHEGSVIMNTVSKLEPDAFVLEMRLKPGSSPDELIRYLKDEVVRDGRGMPILQAIQAIDTIRGDRHLEIRCDRAALSPEELAEELHAFLESAVTYRELDHPMHGIITDIRQEDNKVTVSVGGEHEDDLANTKAFLEDFVKHHKKRSRPEMRGVKDIETRPSQKSIVITCGASKEPGSKVAKEVVDTINRIYPDHADKKLRDILLKAKAKGSVIMLRVMGPEGNYEDLMSSLKDFFSKRAAEGDRCASCVSKMEIKVSRKVSGDIVAVKFKMVEEPPSYDTGGGHMVACYLYRPPEKG